MHEARPLLMRPSAQNVGRRVRVEPRQEIAILDLAGEDWQARSLHLTLTIEPVLALEALDADAIDRGADILAARAQIEVGSGGHRVALELDVLRGVGVTLCGSSLRVTAINTGGASAEVGAFASYAETPASSPPRLTVLGPPLAERSAWTLEVPAFASAVEVLSASAIRVEVGLGRAGERWLYAEDVERFARTPRPLPLANGCGRLRVTNRGPGTASPVAVFLLAL